MPERGGREPRKKFIRTGTRYQKEIGSRAGIDTTDSRMRANRGGDGPYGPSPLGKKRF